MKKKRMTRPPYLEPKFRQAVSEGLIAIFAKAIKTAERKMRASKRRKSP